VKTRCLVPGALFAIAVLAAAPAAAAAPDKNGVAPNTVSLPSGPGSIEGLGESFQPMLNTGSARTAVGFALPKGTGGQTPSLKLQYESGFGDGPAGIGWAFGPGAISRQVDKGIPRYVDGPNGLDDDHDGEVDEADETDTFVGPDGEELVPVGGGFYRARIEGGFARFRRVGDGWEVTVKSGTRLEFGLTTAGRVSDASGTKVFRWLLERSTDTSGNVIAYSWVAFPGSDNQRYLRDVRYGPGAPPWPAFSFVVLAYEDKPDWRADYRSGFLVKTAKRLLNVHVGVQGVLEADAPTCTPGDWYEDGAQDRLISRYDLAYDPAHPDRSFLQSVTRYGADGVNRLPPVSFAYAVADPQTYISAQDAILEAENAPPSVMDSGLAELVDLNRDGLADVLQTDLYGGAHTAWLNLGPATQGSRRVIRWETGREMRSEDGLAPALHLAEQRVHLADMDGDGIADLVHMTQGGDVAWFPNKGDVSWGAKQRMGAGDTAPAAPFTSKDVTTADIDFDKRTDLVRSSEAGYTVWFNLDGGRYSREVHTPGATYLGRVIQFSDPGVQLADMNGDRVPDVVRVLTSRVVVAVGMGHGVFAPAVEIPIPDEALTDGANGQVGRAKLTDVNGDGLADLVVERAAPRELYCWLNRGTNAFSRRIVIGGMSSSFSQATAVRWADLNGNGTTDLVYADSAADVRLRTLDIGELLGGSAHPNLLVRTESGLGVTTTITYRSSTEHYVEAREAGRPWVTTVPFPVQLVSEVATTTGMDLDDIPGVDRYLKDYAYRDGYYEDRELAFRGFAEVRVQEPGDETAPARVGIHGFYTGGPDGQDNDGDEQVDEVTWSPRVHREEDALKGMVRYLERRGANGTLFDRQESTWRVRTLRLGADGTEIRFAYNTRQDQIISEGTTAPETIRTEFAYDNFGNVTEEKRYGALSVTGDESFSHAEYAINTTLWMLGRPRRQYVTDAFGKIFSETFTYYDGADYVGLPLGQIEKGRPTRVMGWVKDREYVSLARSAYDQYGNPVGLLDPNGNRRSIAWDTLLHGYPVREEIEVGGGKPALAETVQYDLGLGVVTSGMDFNGQVTTFGHDTFGRVTAIVRPGDNDALPSLAYRYRMADPANSLTYDYAADGTLTLLPGPASASAVFTSAREVSGQPGTLDAIGYVDGLGRALAAVGEGESGFIVSGAVRFNAAGSVWRAFLPYDAASSAYVPPDAGRTGAESRYDALGRTVRQISPPDDAGLASETSAVFLPLKTTAIDENGKETVSLTDGFGRLVEVQENTAAGPYLTRYAYDTIGKLLRATDPLDNVKTFGYDGLGRNTLLEDPDRGRMEYSYDAAGNLLRRVDNKGQAILYEYDGANRLLAAYPLDGRGPVPSVAYHYDTVSPDHPLARNLLGRVSWVEDDSGAEYLSYDARGQVVVRVKQVRDAETSRSFKFVNSYDALGRVTVGTFPDGDRVEYRYNNRSLVESIPGLVTGIDYRPSGAIANLAYANGVQIAHGYDPRERMTALRTTPSSGSALQDLSYTFDGVGNILAIQDNRTEAAGSPSNATQTFRYDDLHRLARAEGPGYGAIDYGYDAIGNITSIQSPNPPDPQHIDDALVNLGALSYGGGYGPANRGWKKPGDPAGPHAVTGTASGLAYAYDDNGNMTNHAGDLYEWDFNDRLVKATKGPVESRYVYDYAGQRAIKKVKVGGAEKLTFYVDPTYEIREGKAIKYVFAGGSRVAQIEGRLAPGAESGVQVVRFESGWNFFSLEVEPGTPAAATVLDPIAGKYTALWAWDAGAQAYLVPTELHAQRGYLIHASEAVTFLVQGTKTATDIPLVAGWNLIPSPADKPLAPADALAAVASQVEVVWGNEPADGTWQLWTAQPPAGARPLSEVVPGRAYWLKATAAAILPYQAVPTKITWFHPDHLGSGSLTSDAAGAVAERLEFYPYGRVRYRQNEDPTLHYTFTGKEEDKEIGLHYFGARYYDSVVGRWTSEDKYFDSPAKILSSVAGQTNRANPHGLFEGNPYSYVLNNPIKYIDEYGLEPAKPEDKAPTLFKSDRTADQPEFAAAADLGQEMANAKVALKEVLETPTGKKLKELLEKQGTWKDERIELWDRKGGGAAENGGSLIIINPLMKQKFMFWDKDGKLKEQPADIRRILAHELAHNAGLGELGADRLVSNVIMCELKDCVERIDSTGSRKGREIEEETPLYKEIKSFLEKK
jgi:RHS repeat-associated protein